MAFAALTALATVVWTRPDRRRPRRQARFFDNWLYNGVIGGAVVLVLWRGDRGAREPLAWLLVGAGMGSWLAGDIWWVIHAEDDIVPIPSLADGLLLRACTRR